VPEAHANNNNHISNEGHHKTHLDANNAFVKRLGAAFTSGSGAQQTPRGEKKPPLSFNNNNSL
jgi:hypothetical protein